MTLEDLMDCPTGAQKMVEIATDAVFATGRTLPKDCYQAFLVGVIQSAVWCLRRVAGDVATHAALTAASTTLNTPIENQSSIQ